MLINPNKVVLAQVFVMLDVSGSTGGTSTLPIHEVPLLRKKVKDIGKGASAVFAVEERNRPAWIYKRDEFGNLTDVEAVPRVKGMTIAGLRDEFARLTRKYKYQITDGKFADAFTDIYSDQRRLSESIKRMADRYLQLSKDRTRILTIDEWESIAAIASPEADVIDMPELELGNTLPSREEAAKAAVGSSTAKPEGGTAETAESAPPKTAKSTAGDLAKHLLEANWPEETVKDVLELVDEHGTDLPEELIASAHIKGIGASLPRVRSLMKCIGDFTAAAAVS